MTDVKSLLLHCNTWNYLTVCKQMICNKLNYLCSIEILETISVYAKNEPRLI